MSKVMLGMFGSKSKVLPLDSLESLNAKFQQELQACSRHWLFRQYLKRPRLEKYLNDFMLIVNSESLPLPSDMVPQIKVGFELAVKAHQIRLNKKTNLYSEKNKQLAYLAALEKACKKLGEESIEMTEIDSTYQTMQCKNSAEIYPKEHYDKLYEILGKLTKLYGECNDFDDDFVAGNKRATFG